MIESLLVLFGIPIIGGLLYGLIMIIMTLGEILQDKLDKLTRRNK